MEAGYINLDLVSSIALFETKFLVFIEEVDLRGSLDDLQLTFTSAYISLRKEKRMIESGALWAPSSLNYSSRFA